MKLSVLLTVVFSVVLAIIGAGYYFIYVQSEKRRIEDFKALDNIVNSFSNYLLLPTSNDWRRKIEMEAATNGESPFGDGKRGITFSQSIVRNVIYLIQQDAGWGDNWGGEGRRFDGATLLKYRRAYGGGF